MDRHPPTGVDVAIAPPRETRSDDAGLLAAARVAAERAYAPYSHFRVGAALRDAAGATFAGCNVENASYGLTLCAERAALVAAIAAGAARPFTAVAVVCLDDLASVCTPCGACRQVLSEHCSPDAVVVLADGRRWRLADLLPEGFHLAPPSARAGRVR